MEPSQDTLDRRWMRLLSLFKKEQSVTLLRERSALAARQFRPGVLDFVYIDANHYYEYALLDLFVWCRVVKAGGYIAGDDYIETEKTARKGWAVKDAVNHFMDISGLPMVFLNDEPDGSWVLEKVHDVCI